jgi:hypothetical protein
MKFIAFCSALFFLMCLLSGCGETVKPQPTKLDKGFSEWRGTDSEKQFEYTETKIEDCEYLMMRTTHNHYVVTHKGNCKNPIHYKK